MGLSEFATHLDGEHERQDVCKANHARHQDGHKNGNRRITIGSPGLLTHMCARIIPPVVRVNEISLNCPVVGSIVESE